MGAPRAADTEASQLVSVPVHDISAATLVRNALRDQPRIKTTSALHGGSDSADRQGAARTILATEAFHFEWPTDTTSAEGKATYGIPYGFGLWHDDRFCMA